MGKAFCSRNRTHPGMKILQGENANIPARNNDGQKNSLNVESAIFVQTLRKVSQSRIKHDQDV